MGRLIDEDDVKRRMHETMDYQDLYLPVHFEMCMNDAPTVEPASPWRRVEDELPEPTTARKWYLVALESGTVMTNAFEKDRGDWWALASPVKYWMPLPEPPKEGV